MLKHSIPDNSVARSRSLAVRKNPMIANLMITTFAIFLPAIAVAQTGPTGTAGAASAMAHLSPQDMQFLRTASAAGLSEVQEGQMAQSKGDAAVQKIGAQMVTDHTRINHQLANLAQMKGIVVSGSASNAQAAQAAYLNELGGASFNRIYLRDQKRAHEQAIKLFQTEAQSGTDADLKKFAATNLPILQQHLQMIEAAQKQEATSA
jgi:putative membrane protein